MKKTAVPPTASTDRVASTDALVGDIRALIEETRSAVATAVNAGLTLLYWRIGKASRELSWDMNGQATAMRLSRPCRDN